MHFSLNSKRIWFWILRLPALLALPAAAEVAIAGHPIQIHGFFSQGFAYSNVNDYLTMNTSQGSFAFTDAGLNASTQLTDKLRIGAQAYVRNVGHLGRGHLTLDWALADYRFRDWLGVRAGKVKTTFGLYNDTQDMESVHTWALLPQGIYPLDLREASIAHTGADLYGTVSMHRLGELAYTAYAGALPSDLQGGIAYGLRPLQLRPQSMTGTARGVDLKWTSPIPGLLLGASYLQSPIVIKGFSQAFGLPFEFRITGDDRSILYAQYTHGKFRLDGEYTREVEKDYASNVVPDAPSPITFQYDRRAWYAAIAYRLSKHLEVGAYNSRYFPDADRIHSVGFDNSSPATRHIFDRTATVRIDFAKYFDFKAEAHFIDGVGDVTSSKGFYPTDNGPQLAPRTNLLILRLGGSF